ncbi:MAG TPA: hypothetical protein VM262_16120 [Acidimicrobiales bacterium]|nr:hypothetical protein [Acidimicrobiales bacterium]
MSKIDEVTIGDLKHTFIRYRPFIAVVASIAALMLLLPGEGGGGGVGVQANEAGTAFGRDSVDAVGADAGSGALGDPDAASGGGATSVTAGGVPSAGGPGGGATSAGSATTGGNPSAAGGGTGTASGPAGGMVDNCDPATGRIMVPSRSAVTCLPKFTGDNGGSTHQGVTADTIRVAWYSVQEDAATDAVLTAANANDSDEQVEAQIHDWIDYYESHHQMYGRKVELHMVTASGPATDNAAGKADALKIATEIKAFAALNAPNNAFVDELVARGVMCMCTVSQPVENYLRWAPYVWTTLMASTQGYIHRAEYIGKRLAGGNAQWAGSPAFQAQERKFGIIYYDTDDKSYKPGLDFFVQHLRDEYGVTPAVVAEYHGYPETARSQEEARPLIQKLVQAGVTSVVCVCDPFGPIFFTSEATRQAYLPEWIITGSALTDTSFFARLYDQQQWSSAFGISFLTARLPEELSDSYRLHTWHHGREPSAPAGYGIIRGPMDLLYQGIHYAGPNLNPGSFRDGMFASPPSGENSLTGVQQSFGEKGYWPWPDYVAFDDVTEIWWDRDATGEDEIGSFGRGLYRYVDGGKRYLPTQHPNRPPKAFDTAGTVLIYEEPPEQDRWPEYPPPERG